MADAEKTIVSNRKAFHDYKIEERFEAGLVLRGSEVKSLREGKANLREAYAVVRDGAVVLTGMHIAQYTQASTHEAMVPDRTRKLLLHKKEIAELQRKTQAQGYTIVPLRVYFKRGLAKVELGLGKGKRTFDRRQDLAARDAQREMERARRRIERG